MRLVVGLGNPGKKYQNNRHNVGSSFLDFYIKKLGYRFKRKIKFDYFTLDNVIFIKPKTYMNRSGDAVSSILTKYKIAEILVLSDDIYLPLGEVRIRKKGSPGGHNGLRSISESLGSNDFSRLRIGVGAPEAEALSQYVLDNFSKKEEKILKFVFDLLNDLLESYHHGDLDQMINEYSVLKKSYSKKILDS
ncbi:MAG: aminoacyl-tRNA hydrolase [Candidatus Cloacimonetes bacterium]|nr:aminoacyl-tRNA hydrolase [Candidatus Cloacimonadota bacterium]